MSLATYNSRRDTFIWWYDAQFPVSCLLAYCDPSYHHVASACMELRSSPGVSLHPHEYVSPTLVEVPKLLVQFRITFELRIIMYRIKSEVWASYLTDIVHLVQARSTRSGLSSANRTDFYVPRLRTRFSERASSYLLGSPLPGFRCPRAFISLQNARYRRNCWNLLFLKFDNVLHLRSPL